MTDSEAGRAPGWTTRASPLSWVTIHLSEDLSAAVAGVANRKDRAANDKASLNMADSRI